MLSRAGRYVPDPLIATVCGLPPPVSFTFRVALREPAVAGLKVNVTLQLADGPSVEPHLFEVMLKSVAFVPDFVMPLMVTELLPVFVTVTVCAGLVVPTLMLPKLRLAGVTVITVPVPDNDTF